MGKALVPTPMNNSSPLVTAAARLSVRVRLVLIPPEAIVPTNARLELYMSSPSAMCVFSVLLPLVVMVVPPPEAWSPFTVIPVGVMGL